MPDSDTINYQNMLGEALSDKLPDYMQKALGGIHAKAKEYLSLEPPPKTSKIRDMKVVVNPRTAKDFLEALFEFSFDDADDACVQHMKSFQNEVKSNHTLHVLLTQCLNPQYSNLDLANPWLTDIYALIKKPVLYLPEGKKTKEQIAAGNPKPAVLSKNLVNINTWLSRVSAILGVKIKNPFLLPEINTLCSFIPDDASKFDMDIFAKSKLYFLISGEAEDILRMSISNFYDSCQNLYDGDLNEELLGNVFDKHMKVGYIILDMPYKDRKGNLHPYMALSRAIIRDIGKGLFIDTVYPERTRYEFQRIAKQSGIKAAAKPQAYYINTNDLPNDLLFPHMDSLKLHGVIFDSNVSLKTVEKYVASLSQYHFSALEEMLEKIPLKKDSIKKFCLNTLWKRAVTEKLLVNDFIYAFNYLFRFTDYDVEMEDHLYTLITEYGLLRKLNRKKVSIDSYLISEFNRSKFLTYFGIPQNKNYGEYR